MSLADPSTTFLNANELETQLGVDWAWIKAHADHMPHTMRGGGFKVNLDDVPVWQELARAAQAAPQPRSAKPKLDANELLRQVRDKNAEATKNLRTVAQTPAERRAEGDAIKQKTATTIAAIHANENTRTPPRIIEGRIYRRDGNHSFIRDLDRAKRLRDGDALARLERNNAEYREWQMQAAGVNQSATSGGEFVPPVWLVEEAAPLLRAGRPFLNALGTKPLPRMTNQLNIPKITTGSSAAVQADAGAVSNTDLVTTSVTAQVQTVAGRSIVSYQDAELSAYADAQFLQDLAYATYTQLDLVAITGAVTNAKGILNQTGINAITYTDATPTGPEFWAPVTQAAAQVGKNGASPAFGVTHPSIWWNIAGSLDTTNLHPVYATVGSGRNLMGTSPSSEATPMLPGESDGLIGNIAGLPICVDPNVPVTLGGGSNESRIIVLNRLGFDFYESPLLVSIDGQTRTSTLENVLIGHVYYACASRQPKMVSVISGTGCIPVAAWS